MKRNHKNFYNAIGDIDEGFILEADQYCSQNSPKKKLNIRKFIGCAAVAASLLLLLILPIANRSFGTDALEQYENHPYYNVIQAIYQFEALYAPERKPYFPDITTYNDPFAEAPTVTEVPIPDGWEEDVEGKYLGAQGTLNGTRYANTDTHAFYINDENKVEIYSLQKEASALVTTLDLRDESRQLNTKELYLINENKTLLVLSNGWKLEGRMDITHIVTFDLTKLGEEEPQCPKAAEIVLEGYLISSRYVDKKMLIRLRFDMLAPLDFETNNFIPSYLTAGKRIPLAPEHITANERPCDAEYNVLYQLDEALNVTASHAVMGRSTAEFVTNDTYYLVAETQDTLTENGKPVLHENEFLLSQTFSTVVALGYRGTGFEIKGRFTLPGSIRDQDSFNEHEGVLRLASTTRKLLCYDNGEYIRRVWWKKGDNISLYCLSLDDFSTVTSYENFVTDGQSVKHIESDGVALTVTTDSKLQSSAYIVDLSDPNAITHTTTDPREHDYDQLLPFGEEYCLKVIADEDNRFFTLELYRQNDENRKLVSRYTKDRVFCLTDVSFCIIDPESHRFGISFQEIISDYKTDIYYAIFQIEHDEIKPVTKVMFPPNVPAYYGCGFVHDGYFYFFFGKYHFTCEKIEG